jgi:hypothetical protein
MLTISFISEFQTKAGKTLYSVDFAKEATVAGMKISQPYGRLIVNEVGENKVGDTIELPAHSLESREFCNEKGEKFTVNFIRL